MTDFLNFNTYYSVNFSFINLEIGMKCHSDKILNMHTVGYVGYKETQGSRFNVL